MLLLLQLYTFMIVYNQLLPNNQVITTYVKHRRFSRRCRSFAARVWQEIKHGFNQFTIVNRLILFLGRVVNQILLNFHSSSVFQFHLDFLPFQFLHALLKFYMSYRRIYNDYMNCDRDLLKGTGRQQEEELALLFLSRFNIREVSLRLYVFSTRSIANRFLYRLKYW